MSKILWRMSNGLMSVFFYLAAAVQHNDPDWYLWMPLYLTPSVITTLQCFTSDISKDSHFQNILKVLLVIFTCISLHCLAYFLAHETPNHILSSEEGRELLGSLIVTLWLLISSVYAIKLEEISVFGKYLIITFSLMPLVIWFFHYFFGIQLC